MKRTAEPPESPSKRMRRGQPPATTVKSSAAAIPQAKPASATPPKRTQPAVVRSQVVKALLSPTKTPVRKSSPGKVELKTDAVPDAEGNIKLGQGLFGSVVYDTVSQKIIKKSEILIYALKEFLVYKELEIYHKYKYAIESGKSENGKDELWIVSDASGENDLLSFAPLRPTRAFRRMVCDLLLQLKFIHSRNIYHRDIKADNILCRKIGNAYHTYFIDFGSAFIDLGIDPLEAHVKGAHIYEGYIFKDAMELDRKRTAMRDLAIREGALSPAASDIGALGVALIHVLSGVPIFDFMQTYYPPELLIHKVAYHKAETRGFQPYEELTYSRLIKKIKQQLPPLKPFSLEHAKQPLMKEMLKIVLGDDDPIQLDFFYHMINPRVSRRYSIDKLLHHPYLASVLFTDVYASPPQPVTKLTRLNPRFAYNALMKYGEPNYGEVLEEIREYIFQTAGFLLAYRTKLQFCVTDHAINLLIRVLNEGIFEEISDDKHLNLVANACFIISLARVCDLSLFSYENRKVFEYVARITETSIEEYLEIVCYIVSCVDCRCDVF
jgi:serine/threonine protein kinase